VNCRAWKGTYSIQPAPAEKKSKHFHYNSTISML